MRQVAEMPDDQALESRASAAAECLRLAASATDPASRVSLLQLAQKWIQWTNKRAAKSAVDAYFRSKGLTQAHGRPPPVAA
jgi:hypothetical protein